MGIDVLTLFYQISKYAPMKMFHHKMLNNNLTLLPFPRVMFPNDTDFKQLCDYILLKRRLRIGELKKRPVEKPKRIIGHQLDVFLAREWY